MMARAMGMACGDGSAIVLSRRCCRVVLGMSHSLQALGITNLWDRIEHVVGVDQAMQYHAMSCRRGGPGNAISCHSGVDQAMGSGTGQGMRDDEHVVGMHPSHALSLTP